MKRRFALLKPYLVLAVILLGLVLLCIFVPGFGYAVGTAIECSFSPYACVKVVP